MEINQGKLTTMSLKTFFRNKKKVILKWKLDKILIIALINANTLYI